jgi:hypothetical protein
MLTDFFIATPPEVQALDIAQTPATTVRCLRAKCTDPVKIVQLQCCIDGASFEERMPLLNKMLVRQAGEEGPWIFQLPEVLATRLASASTDELDRFGRAWAATEEWQRDRGTPQTIVPFLTAIAQFAVEARTQNRSVYIWMSL